MEEVKGRMKNLCALIPESLHQRVREEQERSGKNLGEYMTLLINEYYDLKEGAKMKEKDTNMKVLAVQISAELFDALDEYIAKHNIKSKKELITSLIWTQRSITQSRRSVLTRTTRIGPWRMISLSSSKSFWQRSEITSRKSSIAFPGCICYSGTASTIKKADQEETDHDD